MTTLTPLRERIDELRRRRRRVRWSVGIAGGATALLWTLAAAFAVDFTFQMTRPQRLILLLLGAGAVGWAWRRFVSPWLNRSESEVDVALQIERQQQIDSDLVAALQFERPDAAAWGSAGLQHAVIEYVAEFARGWKPDEKLRSPQLIRRSTAAGITLAILLTAAAIWPGHAAAFLNRMLLGSAHYPTRTILKQILINGQPVSPAARTLRLPYGSPLRFEIHAAGELPTEGIASVRSLGGGVESTVKLTRTPRADLPVFAGQLPDLVESLSYELALGDAWTDPATIEVIAAPVVEMRFTAATPPYARAAAKGLNDRGAREVWAMEGSRIDLEVVARNKALKEVTLTLEDQKLALRPAATGEAGRIWKLDPAGTPLASLIKPMRYELQVTDSDGLHLPTPIRGWLRIRPDRKPRVLASSIARLLLPTAKAPIDCRIWDDYGIRSLQFRVEITHETGKTDPAATLKIAAGALPILADRLPLSQTVALDLSPLKLTKGDRVKLWIEAEDYRGEAPGQVARSEPIAIQITDEAGILADISEPDEKSAGQLDAIIRQQLGIGSAP